MGMGSKQNLELIKEGWSKYINEDRIEGYINPDIAGSWKRCKAIKVDHSGGCGNPIGRDKVNVILQKSKELLEVSRPIIQNLHSIVLGTEFVLVLTDKDGYVIETIGEESINKKAKYLNFEVGALWTDDAVGTNAIGLCITLDRPIQVVGAEHYCAYHHAWTCSAAPIHDDKGNLIGCIDMSGPCESVHKHTLGIVLAAAYSIENQIALLRSHRLIDTTIESISEGMIIIDTNYTINRVNGRAIKILGIGTDEINSLDIKKMLKDVDFGEKIFTQKQAIQFVDCNFYLKKRKIQCSVSIAPIISKDELIGAAIVFEEMKYLHKTVNTVSGNKASYTFDSIITVDKKMKSVIDAAKKISTTDCNVLIQGESGTGKELFAQSIHNCSVRKNGPFIAVNCASLPRDLIESELFGYERGAFTGASKEGKAGKFELADGGTIFLDEIGELPLDFQAKFLRVLDNFSVSRIGSKEEKKLDVRVVCATNRNLYEEVKKKNFREDLYYRLNVFKLVIPPLRERAGDIKACVDKFLERLNQNNATDKKISSDFMDRLEKHNWKGNVRELQNIIERSYYLSDVDIITEEYLPDEIMFETQESNHVIKDKELLLTNAEREIILNALRQTNGHVIKAGELLNLSKSSMYRKIKKHGI